MVKTREYTVRVKELYDRKRYKYLTVQAATLTSARRKAGEVASKKDLMVIGVLLASRR